MKKYITLILMGLVSICNGQSKLPIVLGSEFEPFLTVETNHVCIDDIIPISMDSINYKVHQYDEYLRVHYWAYGWRSSNNCGVFDQEFQFWISDDRSQWYYCYTDWCIGFMIFEGDNPLPYQFRSTIQSPQAYDFGIKR